MSLLQTIFAHSTARPFVSICVLAISFGTGGAAVGSEKRELKFDRDVRPILSDKCFHCHGPDEANREADLRLDLEEAARYAIGDQKHSELIERIDSDDATLLMPPSEAKKPLTDKEKAILKDWIADGAKWTQHWSFVPPKADSSAQLATDDPSEWAQNPIDDFVLSKLGDVDLKPSPEASKTTLIRRLTFDLTGLPPTLEEVDEFLADASPEAYESLVDRLLASKHFGERMAVMWLDAARYGDTSVYHADGPRDMWAWRDSVVRAYNSNMPFDQFSIAQLAADHLPEATLEEQILGGFNRNNGTTDEGGAFAEEYRVEYCVDRVKTTSTIWLGLTMECAQCHDHKYDPISQQEYYQFYAFFNVSSDKGMQTRKGNAEPVIEVPDPSKEEKIPGTRQAIANFEAQLASLNKELDGEYENWLSQATESEASKGLSLDGLVLSSELSRGKGRSVSVSSKAPTSVPSLRPLHAAEPIDTEGAVVGKVQWVNTPLDKGLSFNGSNYVDFGNVADFERDQQFSYGGWVKPKGNANGAILARMDDANAYRGFDLYAAGGKVAVHLIHDWPSNAVKVTTKKKLKPDEWSHVFATYDGTSKADGIKIYVNGEQWDWDIEQNGLKGTIRTNKSLLLASRHPGSRFKGEIDCIKIYGECLASEDVKALSSADGIQVILAKNVANRSKAEVAKLKEHYLNETSESYRNLKREIKRLESELAELEKPLTTVMVMRDMAKPRDTFILNRGQYDSPTETKVTANTLAALPPMSEELPRNRLGLAQWLFSEEQPLTSRVTVNRYWQMFFGAGLVSTPQDFGAQGAYPSHPELLDWLAVDFRENGWNIKKTIKKIVMSATYRQSSHVLASTYSKDPENRYLSRGPRFRLQAEFIRDNALALSGLLDLKLGGPGVKPYQPPGLWVEVGLSGKPAFKQDHGNSLYRRSLYTYWKRSAPPPTMQIFDAPTREKCTLQRPRTNTPLQALVVLNDPQYVEAARKFAEDLLANKSMTPEDRIIWAFRKTTARQPSPTETKAISQILKDATLAFSKSPKDAEKLLQVGESKRDPELDAQSLAAWTIVTSTLLNMDEALTRE